MELQSKGLRTDIVLDSLETRIENAQDHIILRTPSIPDYRNGNKIIFSAPPRNQEEFNEWMDLYEQNFDVQEQKFIQMTWDVQDPLIDFTLLKDNGFDVFEGVTLSVPVLEKPKRMHEDIHVRSIEWNHDLSSWMHLHIDPDWEEAPVEFQKRYWQVKGLKLQQFQEIFPGQRWIVEKQGAIIADVGLYAVKDMARFHALMVDKKYRNQGIASRILFEASRYAFEHWGVKEQILIAEKNSNAHQFYLELGFQEIESVFEITKLL